MKMSEKPQATVEFVRHLEGYLYQVAKGLKDKMIAVQIGYDIPDLRICTRHKTR